MTTKTTNLTFAELWPLVRDGQCFDYQSESFGGGPFVYEMGLLYQWGTNRWIQATTTLDEDRIFKLVDDPSKPAEPAITEGQISKLVDESNWSTSPPYIKFVSKCLNLAVETACRIIREEMKK